MAVIKVFAGSPIPVALTSGTVNVRQITFAKGVEADVEPLQLCSYFRIAGQQGRSFEPRTDVYEGRLHIDAIDRDGRMFVDLSAGRKKLISESMELVEGAKVMLEADPPQAISILNSAIDVWPNNAPAHKYLGQAYRYSGRITKARGSFAEAIRLNPSDADAYFRFGLASYSLGKGREAASALRESVAIDPKFANACYDLETGCLYYGERAKALGACQRALSIDTSDAIISADKRGASNVFNEYKAAIDACRKALQVDPNDTKILASMGCLQVKFGEHEKGKESIEKAIAADPNNVLALANLGSVLVMLGKYDDAKTACQKAVAIQLNDMMALFTLGCAYLNLKEYVEAKIVSRTALEIEPREVPIMSNLAVAHINLKEYIEAKNICRRALKVQPDYFPALFNLGEAHRGLGEYEEAKAAYMRALQVKVDDFRALYGLGTLLLDLGEYNEAKEVCQRAVEIEPYDMRVWGKLGVAHVHLGELRKAKDIFQRVLEVQPDDSTVWNNLGNVCIGLGQYEDAMCALEKAITLDPRDIDAHLALGRVYRYLGGEERYRQARDIFVRLIEFWPDATAYYNLGDALFELGDYEGARNAYRTAADKEIPDEYDFLRVGVLSLAINDPDEAARYLTRAASLFHDPDEIKTCSALIHWAQAKRHQNNKEWDAASKSFQRAKEILESLPGSEFVTAVRSYERFINIERRIDDACRQESIEGIYEHVRKAVRSARRTVVRVESQNIPLLAARTACLEAVEEILSQATRILRGKRIDLKKIDRLIQDAWAGFSQEGYQPGLDAVDQLKNLREKIQGLNTGTKFDFMVCVKRVLLGMAAHSSLSVAKIGWFQIAAGFGIGIGVGVLTLLKYLTYWQKLRDDEVIRIIDWLDREAALRQLSHPRYASALERVADPHYEAKRSRKLQLKAKKYLEKLQKQGGAVKP